MWEVATAACVFTQPVPFELKEEASERSLTQCTFVPARNEIVTVSVEHNIVLYDAQTLQLRKQVTIKFPLSVAEGQLWRWWKLCLGVHCSLARP